MAWYKEWLKRYLERPTTVEHQHSDDFVCKICDSRYTDEEAAKNCKHEKIKIITRCERCCKLLDLELSWAMTEQLLKEGACTKWSSKYDHTTLTIREVEMDMRGLGAEYHFSFCSLDCLKD